MGDTTLSNLLHELGSRGESVRMFEQSLINYCSKNVEIDGHVIRSCFMKNDLAEPGYKLNLLKAPHAIVLIISKSKIIIAFCVVVSKCRAIRCCNNNVSIVVEGNKEIIDSTKRVWKISLRAVHSRIQSS